MMSNQMHKIRYERIYEGTHVVVYCPLWMLALEIMMVITSIHLPPSEFFAVKEPMTIEFFVELLHPVFLILGCLQRSHYGFRPFIDLGTPYIRNRMTCIGGKSA
jgi:hypothetical protein